MNSVQKTSGSSSITNGHLNNQNLINKDLMDIPNLKSLVNHVRIPIGILMPIEKETNLKKYVKDFPKVNESLINTEEVVEDKEINRNDHLSRKELIHISNDTFEKEQIKLSDKNRQKLNLKTRRRVDITNNTSALHIK